MRKNLIFVCLAILLAMTLITSCDNSNTAPSSRGLALAVNEEGLINALEAGKDVILFKDIELAQSLNITKDTNIYLNGRSISLSGGQTISINGTEGTQVKIINGEINGYGFSSITKSFISIEAGNTLFIENAKVNTDGSALFPIGNAAKVSLKNSNVNALGYGIATNAATPNNYNVVIEVDNSSIIVPNEDDIAGTAIIVNVPCTLSITNSEIVGRLHGVIVRGGVATIKNSTITNIVDGNDLIDYFNTRSWGSGNMVNVAAITFGNKNDTSYQYPTTVKIEDSTIKSITSTGSTGAYPAIYGYGNSGEGLGATLSYKNCTIVGSIVTGNSNAVITNL